MLERGGSFGFPQFRSVAADELFELGRVVAVPLTELGRGCDLLAPLGEVGSRLGQATGPDAIDQHPRTVVACRLVVDPAHPNFRSARHDIGLWLTGSSGPVRILGALPLMWPAGQDRRPGCFVGRVGWCQDRFLGAEMALEQRRCPSI